MNIVIFRKRLIPISETFLINQYKYLSTAKITYLGFSVEKNSLFQTISSKYILLGKSSLTRYFYKVLLKYFEFCPHSIINIFKKNNYGLMHSHFGSDSIIASSISSKCNIPLIVTFHGTDICRKMSNTYEYKLKSMVFKRAIKVIAVSNFINRKVVEAGCEPEKVITHYTGVDCNFFNGEKKESKDPTIIFVGRLVENKGIKYLLGCLNTVNAKFANLKVFIIGKGPLSKEVEAFKSKYKGTLITKESISQIELVQLLSKCWLLCVPSIETKQGDSEGLGTVFLEAQAMKTPVASCYTGGIPEAVINNETGILVQPGNTKALADALVKILKSKKLRESMGVKGREHVLKLFNLDIQTEKLQTIYAQIAEKSCNIYNDIAEN